MNEELTLREDVLDTYRERGAPAGFAGRVAARVPTKRAAWGGGWGWAAVAAVGVVLTAAILIPVSLEEPHPETEQSAATYADLPLFPTRADASTEVQVPGLSVISDIPLFPARPSVDYDPRSVPGPEREGRSARPHVINFAGSSKEMLNVCS